MEHIRRYDWCNFPKNDYNFLDAENLDNCVTEKILRHRFIDPLHSSDEERSCNINWSELKKNFHNSRQTILKKKLEYIPGLKPAPEYSKLSALKSNQHYDILKVIAARNPDVKTCPLPEPTEKDIKLMEDLKEIIEQEMKEYIDWAKSMWMSDHIVRALRPNDIVEHVYDALFNEVKSRTLSIPKLYRMAAQINLDSIENIFEFSHEKDLVKVNMSQLPTMGKLKYSIKNLKPPLPQVCPKHPCQFVLPNEKSKTYLSFQDVQQELAEFAAEHNCEFIFNESAIRCIMEVDQSWMLPVTVKAVADNYGKKSNVYVISSQVFTKKQSSRARVYSALKYLLEESVVPHKTCSKAEKNENSSETDKRKSRKTMKAPNVEQMKTSDEDEEDNLVIDLGVSDVLNMENSNGDKEVNDTNLNNIPVNRSTDNNVIVEPISTQNICTCKGTAFENPLSRSFKKWKINNVVKKQSFNIIIHCSHKCKSANEEVVLEPIPEYQLDLGACKQSEHKRRSLAMSLFLRQKAKLLNVRVDISNCDVIRHHSFHLSDIRQYDGRDLVEDGTNMLHTLCSQLHGLIPGEYILRHELKHGKNALMYVARSHIESDDFINLDPADLILTDLEEKVYLETPPMLDNTLLPYHKQRKILPLMFTPYASNVKRQPKQNQNPTVLANKIKTPKKKKKKNRKKKKKE